jgi:hypothetical protein
MLAEFSIKWNEGSKKEGRVNSFCLAFVIDGESYIEDIWMKCDCVFCIKKKR